MNQKQLFEIAKKLVIYAGIKKKISVKEKNKVVKELQDIKNKNNVSSSVLAKKVDIFLTDIIGDIENDREINIDSIVQDEYIENYFVAEGIVRDFNKILPRDLYISSIHVSGEDFTSQIKKIEKQANDILAKLDIHMFAEMLLIVSLFSFSKPKKYFENLLQKSINISDYTSTEILLKIIEKLEILRISIIKEGNILLKAGDIKSQFIICDIKKNKLSFQTQDAAKGMNKESLYKKILINI